MKFFPKLEVKPCDRCTGSGRQEFMRVPISCTSCRGTGSKYYFVRGWPPWVYYPLHFIAVGPVFGQVLSNYLPINGIVNIAIVGILGNAIPIAAFEVLFWLWFQSKCQAQSARWDPGIRPVAREPIAKHNGLAPSSWTIRTTEVPKQFPRLCPCCANLQTRPEQSRENLTNADLFGFSKLSEGVRVETTTYRNNYGQTHDVVTRTPVSWVNSHKPVNLTKAFPFCPNCRKHVNRAGLDGAIMITFGCVAGCLSIFLVFATLLSVRQTIIGSAFFVAILVGLQLLSWFSRKWAISSMMPECSHVEQPLSFQGAYNLAYGPRRLEGIGAANKLWVDELLRLNPGLSASEKSTPIPITDDHIFIYKVCAFAIAIALVFRIFFRMP